jgi:diguanylate cyclase (GGDEF)-like protein/PAS domain S-box-containing protein
VGPGNSAPVVRAGGRSQRFLPRRWRYLSVVVTIVTAVSLVGISAAEILSLQNQAGQSLRAQVALAEVGHEVDAVRFQPAALVRGLPAIQNDFSTSILYRRELASDADELTQLSPLGTPIRLVVGEFNAAVTAQMAMVAGHQLPAAQSLDFTDVEPLYNQLLAMIDKAEPPLAAQARAEQDSASRQVILVVAGTGVLLGILLVAFEASRRRRLRALAIEEGARASSERFRALVQNGSDMITVVDPEGVVLFQASSVTAVLGHSPADIEGTALAGIVHPHDVFRLGGLCQTGSRVSEDLRLRHADGSWRTCEVRGSDLSTHPGVGGIVLNIRDVSERNALEVELRHQAFHDALTGLANRSLFVDRIEHALARQGRSGAQLAVLLIDLDDFKAVNDSSGHGVGDRLLREVAVRLRASAREADTVARLGGDEFAVLLEDAVDARAPRVAAERVLAAFATPFNLGDRSLNISASVGSAVAVAGIANSDELVRKADVAMYVAKSRGKSCWVMFEPGMQQVVEERMQVKTDLVAALAAGDQMELYYQPVVNLETRSIIGVEALLRWNHPHRGLVAPLDFLPLAEDTGLIIPLGHWVLRRACAQARAWQLGHPELARLSMSVNVSGRQLDDPALIDDVRRALADTGLAPQSLVLEITESVLMRDTEATVLALRELKALGVRLAMDDFGTGYSSLASLQHFPIDVLKIDRSFTAGLDGEERQAALAEMVVRIGTTLDLQTVAEGIERADQVGWLQQLGCDYGQGYLFARPMAAQDCEVLLVTHAAATTARSAA